MNRTKIVSKSKKISKSKIFQICSGNHFSPRFMTPCSLLNENIFPKSAPTPRYTILDSRLPLRNTSSEAGALLPAIRGTYRNMTLTKKNFKSKKILDFFWKLLFSTFYDTLFIINRKYFFGQNNSTFFPSQNISNFFLETTFYDTLFIINRKYFSVFRSPQLPLDTQFWTRGLPFANWLKN